MLKGLKRSPLKPVSNRFSVIRIIHTQTNNLPTPQFCYIFLLQKINVGKMSVEK